MRNVIVLGLAQLLAACGQVVTVLLGGLVGAALAPDLRLATLPVTAATLGIAAATLPCGWLMGWLGRRATFVIGAGWAAAGAGFAALAIGASSFWLYCAACAVVGSNLAFTAQYRYAAAESVPPALVSRAVSWVMLGTIVAAAVSPWMTVAARDWLGPEYLGSYLLLGAVFAAGSLVLLAYREPRPAVEQSTDAPSRPWREIAAQPEFRVAVSAAAAAYGVMALVMTATPVSMHSMDGHSVEATAAVLQSHVLAMYLPSLVSGLLVARLGVLPMLAIGLAAEAACALFASLGHGVGHYWIALVALGLGWNLLFVGGTTLLTRTYRPSERYRVQALNDFVMFGVMATGSLLAGVLVNTVGWARLNQLTLVALAALGWALIDLSRRPPGARAPA